jgi:hypothetical protein
VANVDDLPTKLPDYFPPAVGRYEVKPGLVRFGKPLGAGVADGHVFQLDATFPRYRRVKLAARAERAHKYFRTHELTPTVERTVGDFIVRRLVAEHPAQFAMNDGILSCVLTGERIDVRRDGDGRLFDALAMQVQEDLAIVSTAEDRHWLSAIHLSFPNHWAAEDKIGRAFPVIHAPVAGMEQMNRQGDRLVRVMLEATEGLVRFAWGVTWDDELNHHPESPPGAARATHFDPRHPAAYLRVERQTVWGFPEVGAALFTIRTYLYDIAALRRDRERAGQLAAALASMSDASVAYKGLAGSREHLIRWIETGDGT